LELNILKLSEKLKEYIKEAEEETGRPVLIKNVQDVGLNGMNAVFRLDPKYIHVEIIEKKYCDSKGDIDQEGIECVIAHEVTHGLLAYKKKYCQLGIVRRCNKLEEDSVNLICSMIEDIVVNKIMHENNFQILPKRYINMVKDEIEVLRKGKDCYENFNKYPPIFKDRFMVYRYILAWGVLSYFIPGETDEKTIYKFLKIFQKSYPKQYKEAEQIIKIILKNDIFTPEGYCNTVKKCLDLWNLTDLVKLFTY
jgi:hypothetical protein